MRVLWLKTELLHPVDKGGKIRTYNMLRELKRNHHITYLTLDDGSASASEREQGNEYCDELVCVPHQRHEKFTRLFYAELLSNLFSSKPYAIEKYKSAAMLREVVERAKTDAFDVIVCDFLAPAANVPFSLPYPTILFQHNVEAMIWKRHYEVQHNPLKKAYLFLQWRKMRSFEREMCRRFDCVIAVSAEDREQMQHEYSAKAVFDVPTGVDTDFFRPGSYKGGTPNNLVFTGSMDWLPNEDAIRYFAQEVMPLVKQKVPDVTLTVVGRGPSPWLLELSKKDSSIIVTGRVEDVRPYMQGAAVYIVPLRIGGGTRLKIFEAMAMEMPIVSTSVGAEGLPIRHGSELLIADSPASFASSVIRLLQDKSYAGELGRFAASVVREKFAWRNAAESFTAICENTLALRAKPLFVASSSRL